MTNRYINTNKAYRAYEGFEEAYYMTCDIADLIDDCRENIQYAETTGDTFTKLDQAIEKINEIKELIKEKKILDDL